MTADVKYSDKSRTKISLKRIRKLFSGILSEPVNHRRSKNDAAKNERPKSYQDFEVGENDRFKLLELAMVQQEMVLDAAEDYYELSQSPWYWGPLSRDESTHLLKDKQYGSFIVRDSETDFSKFTLTFQGIDSNVFNNRINYDQESKTYSFFSGEVFKSIVALINHAVELSQTGPYCLSLLDSNTNDGTVNKNVVRLLNPLDKRNVVQPLLFMCKAKIRHLLRMHSWNENHLAQVESPTPVE